MHGPQCSFVAKRCHAYLGCPCRVRHSRSVSPYRLRDRWCQWFLASPSCMRVINHNWSATKQRPHPQSVAEISRHSVLSGTGFDNVRHRLGLATRTQISVCKSPFPSAGTACPCSVRKRFTRDHCCRGRSKPGCWIVGSHTRWEFTTRADFQLCLHHLTTLTMTPLCHSLRGSTWRLERGLIVSTMIHLHKSCLNHYEKLS